MLVLRRTRGQSIIIENNEDVIVVKIIKNENGVISIGVDAPKSITVDRQEIYEKRKSDPLLFSK